MLSDGEEKISTGNKPSQIRADEEELRLDQRSVGSLRCSDVAMHTAEQHQGSPVMICRACLISLI